MRRYVDSDDRGAFELLFQRYYARLYGLFMRSLAHPESSEELVQRTFLQLHRARRDYDPERPFRPWLFTIAMNLRREHFRRRARRSETPYEPAVHGEPSVPASATTATERLVRRALQRLPDGQREVIVLHWYEQLSFKEIATIVGASTSAVKVRAHRGYSRLRDELADHR